VPPKGKSDNAAYRQLIKDIGQGDIGRLYVFCGEEVYLRRHCLEQIRAKLLPPGMEDFNLHTLAGKDFDLKALEQMVECLPMMSERTLVLVTDWDIYKGDRDGLAELFADLPEYVCLIFIYDLIEYKGDARTKLAAALKQYGSLVSFDRQSPQSLEIWVKRHFKAAGQEISSEDARYLIFLCGDLMTGLNSEIEKISTYAGGDRITRADIDAVATPQLDAVVFQVVDRLAEGDFDRAAAVLSDLFHMQEPPIKLLGGLGYQLRQLYAARLTLEAKKGSAYLSQLCGVSPYRAERLLQTARRLTLDWCRQAVRRCGELDLEMKSTGADGEELLTQLLLELSAPAGGTPC